MAKKNPPPTLVEGRVEDFPIEREMRDSYLNYAMSVIVSRALPDVRDGLKPSQRRLLVTMNDLNLTPGAKYRKCAKICGDCIGNYHPHGEQVLYPTLVRMAQEFVFRYPLVDGQGNFGSIDGDPPAAMRYTEARTAPPSTAILSDLELDTVDFAPNYDESRQEPVVLPSTFPNLLANGASGIAVGMACSIPPHNVREVAQGVIKVIEDPEIELDELLHTVKGPDFPTGGIICGRKGFKDAYSTGRGIIVVRAKLEIEEGKGGRKSVVVREIPYQLNKVSLIERIADLVKTGRIKGISDIRDESDKDGMRLVIELKKGEDDQVIVNQLYKHSPLQDRFSIILIALVDGRPRTLTLKEMLVLFKDHRVEVIERRARFLLDKAEKRAHIVEGLKLALRHIDEVVKIIRTSASAEEARDRLMERFKFSLAQVEAILQMRLQRLVGLEQEKLDQEYRELIEKIAYYKSLLANRGMVLEEIKQEMQEIQKRYGDKRRTEIQAAEAEIIDLADLVAEEPMVVTGTHDGYVKRMSPQVARSQHRGGKGVTAADVKEGDFIEHLFYASTHDYLLFFTSRGRIHWQKVYELPEMGRTARGRALVNLLQLSEGETVTSMMAVEKFDDRYVVMATANGVIKKTALKHYSRPKRGGIIALSLEPHDYLVGVRLTNGDREIILATEQGQAIRFHEKRLRGMGRVARGVRGIRLRPGDKVRSLALVEPGQTLLTACEKGYGKRTAFDEYRQTNRGGKGIINIRAVERNGRVVAALEVTGEDELMMITSAGMMIRSPVESLRSIGRSTQGVRLISLKEGDRLVSVTRIPREKEEESGPLVEEAGALPPAEEPADGEPEGAGDAGENGDAEES